MLPPGPDAVRVAERYRIALPVSPGTGSAGERLGRGTGASLEFQDRRSYVPGDDIRHLDWRAFARTDQLYVRLYREEVLPRVDLLVDATRSMASEPDKARRTVELAWVVAQAARHGGFGVHVLRLAEGAEDVALERLRDEGLELDGTAPLPELLPEVRGRLRRASLRFVISDFLFEHDAAELVRPLAADAAGVALLQVLSREDVDPPAGEALRLTDAETAGTLDLVLDTRTVGQYLQRLRRLGEALRRECRRTAGRFVTIRADLDLEQACRTELVPAGVLAPA